MNKYAYIARLVKNGADGDPPCRGGRAQYPLDRGGKLGGPQTKKRKKNKKKNRKKSREKKPSPISPKPQTPQPNPNAPKFETAEPSLCEALSAESLPQRISEVWGLGFRVLGFFGFKRFRV